VGTSYNAVQATGAAQPTFDADGLGGLPGIVFDGTDDFLQTGIFTALTLPFSVVSVHKMNALATGIIVGSGASSRNHIQHTAAGSVWSTRNGGTQRDSVATWTAGTLYLASAVQATGNDVVQANGTTVINADAGDSIPNRVVVGARGDAAAAFANATVAFVGLFQGDVTADANWPAFKAWVARYGITAA
jgi:hypothetical protein